MIQSEKGLWTGVCRRFDSLPSTNTWALEHLAELREGDLIRADIQTGGRGRFDRTWLAEPGKCLTVSIVLKEEVWLPLASNLGQVAAWAVSEVLAECSIPGQLKWPNDVMVNDCKISGILSERGEAEDGFVVGIGLNINMQQQDFKRAGLSRPATSMADAAGQSYDVDTVMALLRETLARTLDTVREQGLAPLWLAWSSRDWLAQRCVQVSGVDGELTRGSYLGLSPDGGLRIETDEGGERVCWAGDVERVQILENSCK
jgi:BirA family transcriptional regulator, biotin operon repressor / biotin---[acetyl-CoA-carboxylase] ligase